MTLIAAASFLAASPARLGPCRCVSKRATSPLKNRVRGFSAKPSGRKPSCQRSRFTIATGYSLRRYEIASGRAEWISRDPIWERGGNNIYGFTSNRSINTYDIFGLEEAELTCDCEADIGNKRKVKVAKSFKAAGSNPDREKIEELLSKTLKGMPSPGMIGKFVIGVQELVGSAGSAIELFVKANLEKCQKKEDGTFSWEKKTTETTDLGAFHPRVPGELAEMKKTIDDWVSSL